MSRGQSAFNVVGDPFNARNTLQLKVSETDSSSETHSSIPELSRAEERAINRSSATFAPIGQADAGRSSIDYWLREGDEESMTTQTTGDILANWRPSGNLMMDLDHVTGPRRTTDWDGDGLEVSQHGANPVVDLISPHVRGSTPDSVVSSGNLRLSRDTGERRDVNLGNIQQHSDQRGNMTNLAKSTRDFVQMISFDQQPGTSTQDIDLEVTERRRQDDTYTRERSRREEKPEKSRYFLSKCLLFVLVLMMLLSGIVALIVVVKNEKDDPDKHRGNILPDPITVIECPTVTFYLGDTLNFTCTFDLSHKYREHLVNATSGQLRPTSRALPGGKQDSIAFSFSTNIDKVRSYTVDLGRKANCSSAGSYDVMFLNSDSTVIHTATVNFTIKQSRLNVTFIQRQLDGDQCTNSEFDATCKLQNDCNNYQITFYRRRNGREERLNHLMSCSNDYSDDRGYSVNCTASIPDNLLGDYIALGCKMTAAQKDGDTNTLKELAEPFLLPNCNVRESCRNYIPGNPRPFNCSSKSRDIQRLENATCDFEVLQQCFSSGRQIFNYRKDYLHELTCNTGDDTKPVCRLSWCRDYQFISKNEIPGTAICNQYEEPSVTPPTDPPDTTGS